MMLSTNTIPQEFTATVIKRSSNYLLVGQENSVIVYEKQDSTNWNYHSTLTENVTSYGTSVDIDSNYVVVGAPGVQKVFIYELENGSWNRKHTIYPSVQYSNGEFGKCVSLDSHRLAICHPGKRVFSINNVGAIDMYYNLGYGWGLIQSLFPSNYFKDMRFGESVKLQENRVIAGSRTMNSVFSFSGVTNSWIHISNLNNDGSYVNQNSNFILTSSENEIAIFTRYNLQLNLLLQPTAPLSSVSLGNNYFSYTDTNEVLHLFKLMYSNTWIEVLTEEGILRSIVDDDILIVQNSFNEILIIDHLDFTDAPTQFPTRYPTRSPTFTAPTRSPTFQLTPKPTPVIELDILYGAIVIPIIIFVIGMVMIGVYVYFALKSRSKEVFNFENIHI
jgi:hypothetical protein